MTKKNTRFKPGISGNETAKWKPGQSGNPVGKSKRRAKFEEAFGDDLIADGSPEEAAQLLWQAARSKEPWAIQELCRRFSPQPQSLHLIHEVENDELDYSKLTDDDIRQLDTILERAQPPSPDGGESAEACMNSCVRLGLCSNPKRPLWMACTWGPSVNTSRPSQKAEFKISS